MRHLEMLSKNLNRAERQLKIWECKSIYNVRFCWFSHLGVEGGVVKEKKVTMGAMHSSIYEFFCQDIK